MMKKKKDNKGFSLVELIVVIAIMAVLIAVLVPTILGYVEKSKYSKDVQQLDAINSAVQLVVSSSDVDVKVLGTKGKLSAYREDDKIKKIVDDTVGKLFDGVLVSKAFKGVKDENVNIEISQTGSIYINIASEEKDFKAYESGTDIKDDTLTEFKKADKKPETPAGV